jgi:CheY-like chemotaxis protein
VTALHEAQIQVLATADPAAGLAALGQEVYDLILLDFEPPGMDVGALGRRVRMQPGYRATPVILVTGRPEAETRAVLGPDALVEVLAKPVLPLELAVRAVTHLLRK